MRDHLLWIHVFKIMTQSLVGSGKLTNWNSLRRSYAFCMPLSAHRERIEDRSCRNTFVSTIPCDTIAERVSKAIMMSPCAWFEESPHGICSFSLASTRTRIPVMEGIEENNVNITKYNKCLNSRDLKIISLLSSSKTTLGHFNVQDFDLTKSSVKIKY